MKAIKDCEWEVKIATWVDGEYIWRTLTDNVIAGFCSGQLGSLCRYKSKQSAKRNWEKFAKLNKIKKWKYVC